jgi:parallel beta-helix repeat protein
MTENYRKNIGQSLTNEFLMREKCAPSKKPARAKLAFWMIVIFIAMVLLFSGALIAAMTTNHQPETVSVENDDNAPIEDRDISADDSSSPQQNSAPNPQPLYTPHAPIYINGDADFASQASSEGWNGSGTSGDPYIIENYDINASSAYGIHIINTNVHFVVRNCYVHDGGSTYDGIYLDTVTNGAVENSNLSNNDEGIHLYSSSSNTLANNTCSNNRYGIYLSSSSSNTLANNTCSNNWRGILLDSSSGNTLTYNTCSNNYNGIYLDSSSDNTLTNNTCNSNSDDGIYLGDSSSNTLTNNTCSDNWRGIYLDSSSGNTLTYNTCSNNWSGIYLWDSSSNVLASNTMFDCSLVIWGSSLNHYIHTIDSTNTVNGKPVYYYKNQTGITVPSDAGQVIFVNCTNCIVENLVLNNGSVGIELAFSSYVSIRNNTCSNNLVGITLDSSSSNTLTNNTCSSNNWYGIYLYYSSSNTLTYNNITDNTDYGVYFDFNSNSNHIHHNNFINNHIISGVQAYDNTGTNFWNTTAEGNYWSDWISPDNDGDGIVDYPYILDGGAGAQDNYPLVGQVVIQQFPAPPFTVVIIVILFLAVGGFVRKKKK